MSPLLRPVRILLVEDSEDDAFFFRWALQKSGVPNELLHLSDGSSALEHFKLILGGGAARPDIVFLDLKLPSVSGFEILEWSRQQNWSDAPHVVVLSGSEHASDISRAQTLGAAAYLVKPVSVEQLKEHLSGTGIRRSESAA